MLSLTSSGLGESLNTFAPSNAIAITVGVNNVLSSDDYIAIKSSQDIVCALNRRDATVSEDFTMLAGDILVFNRSKVTSITVKTDGVIQVMGK